MDETQNGDKKISSYSTKLYNIVLLTNAVFECCVCVCVCVCVRACVRALCLTAACVCCVCVLCVCLLCVLLVCGAVDGRAD